MAARGAAGRLTFEHDAATAVARTSGGWAVTLAMGRRLRADAVVLAIGNLPPPAPDGVASEVIASPHWIADPWAQGEERRWPQGDVLLIGSGLTAMDVALTIADHAPGARVTALSRHGLAPQPHAPTGLTQHPASPPPGSVLAVLREVRRAVRQDWRAAADGLRPYVQSLWRSWDLAQRQRFLRHLWPPRPMRVSRCCGHVGCWRSPPAVCGASAWFPEASRPCGARAANGRSAAGASPWR
jgi:uncharacterized NAD(P)/FAD-binding protein YdhS